MSEKKFNEKQWIIDTFQYMFSGRTNTADINTTGYIPKATGATNPVNVSTKKNKFFTKNIVKMKKRKFRKGQGIRKRIKALERKTKSIEKKYHPSIETFATSNAGTIKPLSNMAEGDQAINREGIKITFDQIYGKFLVVGDATKTNGPSLLRIVIFHDKEMHGTYPTVANLMETVNVLAQFNHVNRQRFKIIYDHIMAVGNDVDAYGFTHVWKYRAKLKGNASYLGTTTSEGSQGANNLYMMVLTDEATYPPSIAYDMMTRFWG